MEENMWGERCFKRNDEIHGERRMQNGSAFEGNDTSRDACDILNSRMPVIQPRNYVEFHLPVYELGSFVSRNENESFY